MFRKNQLPPSSVHLNFLAWRWKLKILPNRCCLHKHCVISHTTLAYRFTADSISHLTQYTMKLRRVTLSDVLPCLERSWFQISGWILAIRRGCHRLPQISQEKSSILSAVIVRSLPSNQLPASSYSKYYICFWRVVKLRINKYRRIMALFVKNQYALVINLSEIDFHITESELQRKGALIYVS